MFFLDKFIGQKESSRADFKKFYKARLLAENEWLRKIVHRFSPFDQIHISEISQLKSTNEKLVSNLHEKEQEALANLEILQ